MKELSSTADAPRADAARMRALSRAAREASAAVVLGSFQVLMAVSIAALVFSGDLAPFIARGVGFVIVGSIGAAIVVALGSTVPGTFGGSQNSTGAIIAVVAADVAAGMGVAATGEARFATVMGAIAVTTLATGVFLLTLGRFRLGDLVRFLPNPVVGGFIAGTSWLIAVGAVRLMTGTTPGESGIGAVFRPDLLAMWAPGLVFALLLLVSMSRSSHFLVMPLAILGSAGAFALIAGATGTSLQELSTGGWLLGPFPEGNLWRPLTWSELGQVDWAVIARHLPAIAAVLPIAAVAVLLNAGSQEVAMDQDVDLNRELSTAGAANLLAGAATGLVAYQQLGVTTLASKLKVRSRTSGLLAAAVAALTLFAGPAFLSIVPRFILGGMLLYIALGFMKTWLVDAWSRLPRLEYAVVVTILVVIAAVGFVEGVAVGVIAAIVLFVVTYSRIDVVRHETDGTHARSRVTRSPALREKLQRRASSILVLQLHGYVFFGTGDALLRRVRRRLESGDARFLVLDFRRVTGLDSTAAQSFRKIQKRAREDDVTLVLTSIPAALRDTLVTGGVDPATVAFAADLDGGLERCEDELLRDVGDEAPAAEDLEAHLAVLLPHVDVHGLLPYFERMVLAPGESLVRQGDASDRLFIVESGALTARLDRGNAPPLRLQRMGGGNLLGELGFFLGEPRSATVLADERSVVHHLDRPSFERMKLEDPQAALALHDLIVRLLSERVGHLMGVVRSLER